MNVQNERMCIWVVGVFIKRADEGDCSWTSVLLHWSSADPLIHLPLHLHSFLSEYWAQQGPTFSLHSLPFKKAPSCPHSFLHLYSWQPVQSIFHLRSPWFGSCLQSSLFLQSADCFLERNDELCHPVFSLNFCRSEFSLYHHLHGRHFLTHHLGDCVRLLEALQKVPALLSLSTLFDRSKASHDKSKQLALWL